MRIGLVGAADIAIKAIIEPAMIVDDVDVAAVAARDPLRAGRFASEHSIATVHADYEALIGDDSLDAVYIALPNSLHAEWSIAAMERGRHVLCEKPLAANAAQAVQMVETARRTHRVLLEAFHWRYHPVAARLIDLSQRIGHLTHASAYFNACASLADVAYRLNLGGGSFIDLGCYCVHQIRALAREEPHVVRAAATEGPDGIDVTMEAVLSFSSGLDAVARTSMVDKGATLPQSMGLHLQGTDGSLDALNPMAPQLGHRIVAKLADGSAVDEVLGSGTSYEYQLRAFQTYLEGEGVPLTGGRDAVANMTVIDAVYRSAGLPLRR